MNKIFTLLFFLLFIFPADSISKELPFLFSVDQNVKSDNPKDIIKPNKNILSNNWFNSPPSRLELLTYFMNQYLEDELKESEDYFANTADKYFERGKIAFFLYNANVLFDKNMGVFVAKVNLDHAGKPKKPIKEFCDEILGYISIKFSGQGYYLANQFLGPFMFDSFDDPEVKEIVNLLRNNLIVMVSVVSSYKSKKNKSYNVYQFVAYKYTKEEKIHYKKQTYEFGTK
jgi:hypothetical protein